MPNKPAYPAFEVDQEGEATGIVHFFCCPRCRDEFVDEIGGALEWPADHNPTTNFIEGSVCETCETSLELSDPREIAKAKKLKLFNGRLDQAGFKHGYVCAKSRADAVRLIAELGFYGVNDNELKIYWHEGAWGNPMAGIEPERGLWASKNTVGGPVQRLTKKVGYK
jgi:hypothetical protein